MNNKLYLERMEQAISEKLWFTRQLNLKEYDLIIDFGCANGKLLSKLSYFELKSDVKLVGYDKEDDFIKKVNIDEIVKNNISSVFTSSWYDVLSLLERSKKSLIIFSSVMHEMSNDEIESVLTQLVIYGIHTIAIRDMDFIGDEDQEISSEIAYGNEGKDENPYKRDLRENIQTITDDNERQKILTEYLLKYRYVENYERESKENYFSTNFYKIDWLLNCALHNVFDFNYTNNYIKNQIKKDFNINLKHKTHKLTIYKRR